MYTSDISASITVIAKSNLNGGTMGGGTVIIDGTTVDPLGLDSGSNTFSSPGSAALSQSDGTLTVSDGVSVNSGGSYSMSGGTLDSPQLQVSSGGSFSLSGGTLSVGTLSGGGTISISGGSIVSDLANSGTVNLSGGTVSASITNSGTLNLSGGNNDISTSSPPSGKVLTNTSTGVFQKTTTSGTSHVYLPSIWNGGTINVATGSLVLDGASTISAGGTLHRTGSGTLVFNGAQSNGAATLSLASGTTIFNTDVGTNLTLTGSPATVQFNSAQHVGKIGVGTIISNPGGSGSVSVANFTGSGGTINVQSGSMTINNTFGGATIIKRGSGPLTLNGDGNAYNNVSAGGGTVNLNSFGESILALSATNATLHIEQSQIGVEFVSANGGGTIDLASGAGLVLDTPDLMVDSGHINLNDGGLIVEDPDIDVASWVGDGSIYSSDGDVTVGSAGDLGISYFYGIEPDPSWTLAFAGSPSPDLALSSAVPEPDSLSCAAGLAALSLASQRQRRNPCRFRNLSESI
jgi:hypothetical protein